MNQISWHGHQMASGKDHSLSTIFLIIQFSLEIRWVFSHAKLMIGWLQWLGKKVGCPCSLVSYSHFSTDRARYQGKSSMFSMCVCTRARSWHHKLCTVRLRNSKQGNDLKMHPFFLMHIVAGRFRSFICHYIIDRILRTVWLVK